MIFPLFFFFLLHSVIGICPEGTVSDPYSKQWHCLAFMTPEKLYLPGDLYCNDNYGGHLVSIENAFVNLYVTEIADTSFANSTTPRFWIGVNNISGSGWTNIDGSDAPYNNWASGEPASASGTNGCVSVDLKGKWYNDECSHTYSYVCEVPDGSTPPTTAPQTTTTTWAVETTTTAPQTTTTTDGSGTTTTAGDATSTTTTEAAQRK